MVSGKLLIKYGFISDGAVSAKYKELIGNKAYKDADSEKQEMWQDYVDTKIDEDKADDIASQEFREITKDSYVYTGYPPPIKRHWLVYQRYNLSIEETYYFFKDQLTVKQGYPHIDKITDAFTASEHSSFFGNAQQRLGLQQDKVAQFLASIGKMIKDLFQIVRELRIMDERLSLYYAAEGEKKGKSIEESAEISLKGIWIDLVEQGAKNPASVYGMARELQFVTLPDLFFRYHPQNNKEIDQTIDGLEFNRKVKEVLKRKIRQYIEWKKFTFQEMKSKRIFTLRYLRQHYDVVEMYLDWIKPYLRNIQRLNMRDKSDSADMISAFEGTIVELELLAYKFPVKLRTQQPVNPNKKVYTAINAYFYYRTRPMMNYQQEYQKGPIHVGRVELLLRGYAWEKWQIENYKAMKKEEDIELLAHVDSSIREAMESMGGELKKYLEEAEKRILKKKEKAKYQEKPPSQSMLDPFLEIFKVGGMFKGAPKQKSEDVLKFQGEVKRATSMAKLDVWDIYKEYKKAHKIIVW